MQQQKQVVQFRDLIQIKDKEEAKVHTSLIKLYMQKKRDYKFVIVPTYSSLMELCSEFIIKVQPVIRYLIIRLYEQDKIEYCDRWRELLHSIDIENINRYYTKLNSSFYGKTIVHRKLYKILERDEAKIHAVILLVYALCPFKDKPLKQQTIGVPSQEYEEMFDE